MDNEMIDRVAKELWSNDQNNPYIKYGFSNAILFGDEFHRKSVPWEYIINKDLVVEHIPNEWRTKAILAIKAMREPTERMLAANCNDREGWQAMIDAILND